MALIELTSRGLYCTPGDFYIDPWRGVHRAVITHAHADHARYGSEKYLCAASGELVLRQRLGEIQLDTLRYGENMTFNGVRVSLHPAGHILGAAQVRVEHNGEVWVASGDYKLQQDATCQQFEPVRCHTFITESTFSMPIYRWREPSEIFADINAWWAANREAGKNSVVFGYSLGKSQRILGGVEASIGPIVAHSAVEMLNRCYRDSGVALPKTALSSDWKKSTGALVLAPPATEGSTWLKQFEPYSTAVASGWMHVRGARRQRAVDRGCGLSDHVDWPDVLNAIHATGATRVLATHGFTDVLTRTLRERGLSADVLATDYGSDDDETTTPTTAAATGAVTAEPTV